VDALLILLAMVVLVAPFVFVIWLLHVQGRLREAERELTRLRVRFESREHEPRSTEAPEVPREPAAPRTPEVARTPLAAEGQATTLPPDAASVRRAPSAVERTPAVLPARAAQTARTAPNRPEPKRPVPRRPEPVATVDWERWLGVRGAAVVGGVALALAGLFFVQLALQRGWIGHRLRDGLAVGVGALALALHGPLRRRDFCIQADVIAGAGAVLIYLGAWAATRLHGLVPMPVAFAVMATATAWASWLAVRADAPIVAVFALLGGFATPILLDVGAQSTGALFTYLALLHCGALALDRARGWRWAPRTAVGLSAFVQLIWRTPVSMRLAEAPEATPRAGALLAVLGLALVYLLTAPRGERASGSERVDGAGPKRAAVWNRTGTILVALGLQFLIAIDLGRGLALDASLVLVGVMALSLALAAAIIGRWRSEPSWALTGGVGAFGLLASWALMHPARVSGPPTAYLRLLHEFGLFALAIPSGLALVEAYPWRRRETKVRGGAPAAAAVASGLLLAFGALLAVRGPLAGPWFVAAIASGLVALLVASMPLRGGRPGETKVAAAVGLLALLHGVIAGVLVQFTVPFTEARQSGGFLATEGQLETQSAALALVLLGALVAWRSRRIGLAAAGAGVAGLVAFGARSFNVPCAAVVPWYLAGFGGAVALALSWREHQTSEAPSRSTPGLDTALAFSLFSAAVAYAAVGWTQAAHGLESTLAAPALAAILCALAAPGVAAAVRMRGEHASTTPSDSWGHGSISEALGSPWIGWTAPLPLLVAFLGSVQAFAERVGVGPPAAVFLTAAVPAALVLTLALGAAALTGPAATVVALLVSFAVAHGVDVHADLVGAALAGASVAWIAIRSDSHGARWIATTSAFASALLFIVLGLAGRWFLREDSLFAPRLTWTAMAVCAALIGVAWAARRARGAAPPQASRSARAAVLLGLSVAFLWWSLIILNRFTVGRTIALEPTGAPSRDLVLSLGWALFAALLLTLGQVRGSRSLRWASLAVLLATVGKVFLFDLSSLRGGYRVASFLGLAVSLLSVSAVYQRWVLPPRKRTDSPENATSTGPTTPLT